MAISNKKLESGHVQNTPNGPAVNVSEPWYDSLYDETIGKAAHTINGIPGDIGSLFSGGGSDSNKSSSNKRPTKRQVQVFAHSFLGGSPKTIAEEPIAKQFRAYMAGPMQALKSLPSEYQSVMQSINPSIDQGDAGFQNADQLVAQMAQHYAPGGVTAQFQPSALTNAENTLGQQVVASEPNTQSALQNLGHAVQQSEKAAPESDIVDKLLARQLYEMEYGQLAPQLTGNVPPAIQNLYNFVTGGSYGGTGSSALNGLSMAGLGSPQKAATENQPMGNIPSANNTP